VLVLVLRPSRLADMLREAAKFACYFALFYIWLFGIGLFGGM
jgi:hypothetical protein